MPPESKTSYVVKGTTLFESAALNYSRKGQADFICLTCSTHLENTSTAVEWVKMGVESGKQDEEHH